MPSCVSGCVGGCRGAVFWSQRERESPGNLTFSLPLGLQATAPLWSYQETRLPGQHRREWQLWDEVWVRRSSQGSRSFTLFLPFSVSHQSHFPSFIVLTSLYLRTYKCARCYSGYWRTEVNKTMSLLCLSCSLLCPAVLPSPRTTRKAPQNPLASEEVESLHLTDFRGWLCP